MATVTSFVLVSILRGSCFGSSSQIPQVADYKFDRTTHNLDNASLHTSARLCVRPIILADQYMEHLVFRSVVFRNNHERFCALRYGSGGPGEGVLGSWLQAL